VSDQPDLPPSFNPVTYRRAVPRDQERAETKRLTFIVLGIIGVLTAVVLARAFMVARAPETAVRDATGTPVITADSAPVKQPPPAPGGMQVPGADQDVLSGGSSGSGAANGQLAPAEEAPAPDKLAAEVPGAAPAPLPPLTVQQPAAAAPPAATAALPQPVLHHAKKTVHVEVTQSALGDAKVASIHGTQAVQLAALPSEAAAKAEWRKLQHRMPGLLDGHSPRIITVERDGHKLYRLRTDGFADRAAARSFCADVKQQGGNCAVF